MNDNDERITDLVVTPWTEDQTEAWLSANPLPAGCPRWKETHANAKRHSFGSYACKLHGAEWVVDQMGNSVRIFLKHYRNASVTREQAEQYSNLTPANVGQVAPTVPFAKAASKTA